MSRPARPLPVEYLRTRLHYEPETGLLFWKPRPETDFTERRHYLTWTKMFEGKEAFIGLHSEGYRTGELIYDGERRRVKAHRAAFAIYYGRDTAYSIDHINGIRTDNRISNLREATPLQQSQNSRARKGKYARGVRKSGSRWYAYMSHDGQQLYLGMYDTEAEAHRVYLRKCLELRGEFAPFEYRRPTP